MGLPFFFFFLCPFINNSSLAHNAPDKNAKQKTCRPVEYVRQHLKKGKVIAHWSDFFYLRWIPLQVLLLQQLSPLRSPSDHKCRFFSSFICTGWSFCFITLIQVFVLLQIHPDNLDLKKDSSLLRMVNLMTESHHQLLLF